MTVIGIGVNADNQKPFPFYAGDLIIPRGFLHEIDAVQFANARWKGQGLTDMILVRIDLPQPKVIAVLDLRR